MDILGDYSGQNCRRLGGRKKEQLPAVIWGAVTLQNRALFLGQNMPKITPLQALNLSVYNRAMGGAGSPQIGETIMKTSDTFSVFISVILAALLLIAYVAEPQFVFAACAAGLVCVAIAKAFVCGGAK